MITLQELAKLAGVSRMTASRALRQAYGVSPKTRDRIRALAQHHGYQPDPRMVELSAVLAARRHRRYDHSTIAWLTQEAVDHPFYQTPTHRRWWNGARHRAESLGYRLESFTLSNPGLRPKRLSDILRARGIRGLVVAAMQRLNIEQPWDLEWNEFAATTVSYSFQKPPLHRTANHLSHTIQIALDEARRRGYRRPGLCTTQELEVRVDYHWTSRILLDGFRHQSDTRPVPPLVTPGWNRAAFERWVGHHQPDVILTIQGEVLTWLESMGLGVPRDMGLIVLDWSAESGPRSGVDQQAEEVGAAAVDLVAAAIHRGEYGLPAHPRTLLIEGRFVEGKTVGPPV